MGEKRVTIGDISEALGISKSTVSRALSGTGYVSSKVKARIVEAARKMGYVPDLTARNLRRGSSTQIGLVVSSLADPFYAGLATGFQSVALARGYHVMLIIDRADPQEELLAAESLISTGVSGVAITPVSEAAVKRLADNGICVLQLDRTVTRDASLVAGDNLEGGRLATEHLLDHGHGRIAAMVDHARWTTGSARLDGYRAAFRSRGLDVDESLILCLGDTDEEIVQSLPRHLHDLRRKGVTAIFAANSVVSQLLYSYCLDHAIRIPEDLSLVAYDDVHWTSMVRPAVTVISQHLDELGSLAAEALIKQITSETRGTSPTRTFVQPSLLERGSVLSIPPAG